MLDLHHAYTQMVVTDETAHLTSKHMNGIYTVYWYTAFDLKVLPDMIQHLMTALLDGTDYVLVH